MKAQTPCLPWVRLNRDPDEGMNKVLQAAGRVIRDVSDRGVVLLLDQRFRTSRYQELFPLHWQHALNIRRPQELSKALTHFWQEKN